MSDEEEERLEIAIVREVYDSDLAQESFESELERALDDGYLTIIIEPHRLGDETARWIAAGNCLHKTAVLAGFGSIVSGMIWQKSPIACVSLGTLSVFCTGVYTVSWQFDPCCKYQIETNSEKLSNLALHSLSTAAPVVLVRKDDSKRKILHCFTSFLCAAFCAWRLYKLYK